MERQLLSLELHSSTSFMQFKLNLVNRLWPDDMRALLPRGFEVIGLLIVGTSNSNGERSARDAIDASRKMRKALSQLENRSVVGTVVDPSSGDFRFFVSDSIIEPVTSVIYEDHPEKYIWERGCILNCKLPIKLSVYYSPNDPKDAENMLTRATEVVTAKFRDSKTTYVLETLGESVTETPQPVIIQNKDLALENTSSKFNAKSLLCSHFCVEDKKHKSPSLEGTRHLIRYLPRSL